MGAARVTGSHRDSRRQLTSNTQRERERERERAGGPPGPTKLEISEIIMRDDWTDSSKFVFTIKMNIIYYVFSLFSIR